MVSSFLHEDDRPPASMMLLAELRDKSNSDHPHDQSVDKATSGLASADVESSQQTGIGTDVRQKDIGTGKMVSPMMSPIQFWVFEHSGMTKRQPGCMARVDHDFISSRLMCLLRIGFVVLQLNRS